MADSRFFPNHGPFTAGLLAEKTGATIKGNPELQIRDVTTLASAGGDQLSFIDNRKYLADFAKTKAGACFLHPRDSERAPKEMVQLLTETPYTAYAEAAALFYPSALTVSLPLFDARDEATLGDGVVTGAGVIIGAGAEIGDGVEIGAGSVIGEGVVIGRGTVLGAHVVLSHCLIGEGCLIHSGVKIGQDGFGFAQHPKKRIIKVPQLGRVVVGHGVEIGANSTIDRGALPDTEIGNLVKIDNLVQIGHNVQIKDGAIIVAQAGIAGSAVIGEGAQLGGQVGVAGHITIGKGAQLAAQSGVAQSVPDGAVMGGTPAVPVRQWHRQSVALARLTKRMAKEGT